MKLKRYIPFLGLLLMAVSSVFLMSADKPKATIKFAEKVYDFGTIREDAGPVTHKFDFVNDGTANLVIVDATAQCGCTTPSYPKNAVAPGKTGQISVTYNPLGRPGAFDKVVTVRTNGKPGKVHLKIRGSVMPKGS